MAGRKHHPSRLPLFAALLCLSPGARASPGPNQPSPSSSCIYNPAGPLASAPPDAALCPLPVSDASASFAPWARRPYCQRHPPGSARSSAQGSPSSSSSSEQEQEQGGRTSCVFALPSFRGAASHGGLAIIASPAEAADLLGAVAAHPYVPLALGGALAEPEVAPGWVPRHASVSGAVLDDRGRPAYEVRPVAGKGLGVVALRRIARGEVFMTDFPALLASKTWFNDHNEEEGEEGAPADAAAATAAARRRMLRRALRALAPEGRRRLLSLARQTTMSTGAGEDASGEAVEDVMRTNACTVPVATGPDGGGTLYAALFPTMARLNHGCDASAFYRFVPQRLTLELVAHRDVSAGEELTINYAPLHATGSSRRDHVRRSWGFECGCELCRRGAQDPEAERTVDERRTRMLRTGRAEMVAAYGEGTEDGLRRAVRVAEEMARLADEDGTTPVVMEYWELKGRMLAELGEADEARRLGERAVEGWARRWNGVDKGVEIRRLREWMREELGVRG